MGGSALGSPLALGSTPTQDSLLLPLFHGEGSHSPNITQGLIGYTCCPGDLQGVQEKGSQAVAGRSDRAERKGWGWG